MKVTTENLDKIGKIIDKAVYNGVNEVNRISYELSEEKQDEMKKKALKEASQNAYEKAEAIAEGLDKELGNLVSIEESNFYYRAYDYAVAEMVESDSTKTEILPEDLEITAYITLVYKVN